MGCKEELSPSLNEGKGSNYICTHKTFIIVWIMRFWGGGSALKKPSVLHKIIHCGYLLECTKSLCPLSAA